MLQRKINSKLKSQSIFPIYLCQSCLSNQFSWFNNLCFSLYSLKKIYPNQDSVLNIGRFNAFTIGRKSKFKMYVIYSVFSLNSFDIAVLSVSLPHSKPLPSFFPLHNERTLSIPWSVPTVIFNIKFLKSVILQLHYSVPFFPNGKEGDIPKRI